MRPKKWLYIILLLFVSIFNSFSLSLYVDANSGSDSNDGSSTGNSLETLKRAREVVQTHIIGGLTENINIFFSAGVYYFNETVAFTTLDSAPAGYKITYQNDESDENDKVFFVGGSGRTWDSYNSTLIYSSVGLTDTSILYENMEKGRKVSKPDGLLLDEILLQVNVPGEYYHDTASGNLYYYPRKPYTDQIIFIPELDNIVELKGNSDASPIQDINFIDFVFMGSTIELNAFSNPDNETSLMYMENARDITIDSCEFLLAGVSGIVVQKFAQRITIQNNRIDTFNLNGISLCGYMPGDGIYLSPADSYVNRNNNVSNNFIVSGSNNSGSNEEAFCSGISIIQSGDNVINNNRIRYISGNGIRIHGPVDDIVRDTYYGQEVTLFNKWDFIHARDNSIRNNDISRISPPTAGGGIYLRQPGQNNRIQNNCIHDINSNNPSVIPSGIYIGDLSERVIVEDNIIHSINQNSNGRPMFISGKNCTINNNVFSDYGPNSGMAFNRSSDYATDLTIRNNIFNRDRGKYIYTFVTFDNHNLGVCNNNLFYHPDESDQENESDQVNKRYKVKTPYDLYYFKDWQELRTRPDRNSIIDQDPLFEEPGSHYYEVSGGSPALNMSIRFSNIDQDTIGLPDTFAHRYARDLIEAEKGVPYFGAERHVTTIRSTLGGDYARYSNVFFEDTLRNVEIRYSCNASSGENANRQIEIRLDNTSGPLLCSIPITGTGEFGIYRVQRTSVTTSSGVHDILLIFRGILYDIQVDWFHFYETTAEPVPPANFAPEVIFVKPQIGNEFYNGSNITISVIATDIDGHVDRMWLYEREEEGEEHLLSELSSAGITYTWDNVSIGNYTLRAVARDNDGSLGETSINIEVSNTLNDPPVIQILTPLRNEIFYTPADVLMSVDAQDSDNGIHRVTLVIEPNIITIPTLFAVPYNYTWPNPPPGDYTLTATAFDQSGASAIATIDFSVHAGDDLTIGHWPLDTIVSGITEDVSPNANHGTIINNVTETMSIKGAGACFFNGNAHIDTQKSLMNDFPQFTLAGWVRPQEKAEESKVGFFGQREVVGFGFQAETLLQVFTIGKGGISVEYNMDLNEWHHLTVIGDGKGLKVYRDGTEIAFTDCPVSNYGRRSTNFKIGGGGILGISGDFFTGSIDDVWLFNTAIPESQIRAIASPGDNIRPYVRITSPPDGSSFEGPLDIPITVEAYDQDGNIVSVEVYTREYMIDIGFMEPYEFLWTAVPPGTYIVTAKATDNEGAESTHSIMVTVKAGELLAYWSLNEGAGDIAYDTSGNGKNGEISFVDWEENGVHGSCLFFDGWGLVRSEAGLMNDLSMFTVAFWVKPTEIKKNMAIMGQDGVFISTFDHNNNLATWTGRGGFTFAETEIPLDVWSHVSIVGTGEQILIYLNGAVMGRCEQRTLSYGSSGIRFEFGGVTSYHGFRYLYGYLDEIYIYQKALLEDEIRFLATPPIPTSPSMRITSPGNLSRHVAGEPVTIQAEVFEVDLTEVVLELYIDNAFESTIEDPYTTEWTFANPGEYIISLKASSEAGIWAEDSVSVTIITEEEAAEELANNNDEDEDDEDDDDDSSLTEGNDTDELDEDDDGDYDESSHIMTTKNMHSSEDEIYEDLEEDQYKDETLLELIERIAREKENKKNDNEKKKTENNTTGNISLVMNNNGDSTLFIGPANDPDKEGNGNTVIKKWNNGKNEINTASQNTWTWLFGGTDSHANETAGNGRPSPGYISILIILLAFIAAAIACFIIIKKIYGNRKPKYYYE